MNNSYLFNLLTLFLDKQRYSIDESQFSVQLLSHPDYPSLKSITDSLGGISIGHVAISIPKEKIFDIPQLFMAQTFSKGLFKFVLVELTSSHAHIWTNKKSQQRIPINTFTDIWTGVVVLVEKNTLSKSKSFFNHVRNIFDKNKITLLIIIGLAFIFKVSVLLGFLMLSVFGLIFSVQAVFKELGVKSHFSEYFCSINPQTSCDAILNSSGSVLFKNVKLSDLGVLYFFVQILLALLFNTESTLLYFFVPLSSLGSVFGIYSLFYQAVVVKKWCPICLAVVGVLFAQFSILLIGNYDWQGFMLSFRFNEKTIGILLLVLVSIFSWSHLRGYVKRHTDIPKMNLENLKFKRNYHLFISYFYSLPSINTKIEKVDEIILGRIDAPIELLVITNPLCKGCISLHNDLAILLNTYSDMVKVKYRFYVPHMDRSDPRTMVSERLLELYVNETEVSFNTALDKWYSDPSKNWIEHYQPCNEREFNRTLVLQKDWCIQNEIDETPCLFINGRRYPTIFPLDTINDFMEHIIHYEERLSFPNDFKTSVEV